MLDVHRICKNFNLWLRAVRVVAMLRLLASSRHGGRGVSIRDIRHLIWHVVSVISIGFASISSIGTIRIQPNVPIAQCHVQLDIVPVFLYQLASKCVWNIRSQARLRSLFVTITTSNIPVRTYATEVFVNGTDELAPLFFVYFF
jgi:hypothetical protein